MPGAFNGFEMGLRAILGQQVTVKAATTIACRFVEAFGEPIVTPFAELNRLTPAPARVAAASVDDIARHGIIAARAPEHHRAGAARRDRARSCLDGGAHHNPDDSIKRLAELPGIGPWTAHYIAMRALRWPDAFPKEDIAVRNNLGGVTAKEAEALSQAWRPWRSYAVMHVWGMGKQVRVRPASRPGHLRAIPSPAGGRHSHQRLEGATERRLRVIPDVECHGRDFSVFIRELAARELDPPSREIAHRRLPHELAETFREQRARNAESRARSSLE